MHHTLRRGALNRPPCSACAVARRARRSGSTKSVLARRFPTRSPSARPKWVSRPRFSSRKGSKSRSPAFAAMPELQQALAAGSIDVGPLFGTGARLPCQVAPRRSASPHVRAASKSRAGASVRDPDQGVSDLKGKRIGVTTTGSLTDWLVRELSRQQGWGSDGIQILGAGPRCRRGLLPSSAANSTAW